MGLFANKKKNETEESKEINRLLSLALKIDKNTKTWFELPEEVLEHVKTEVIAARKIVFEYIRQLKEAGYYSNGAVQKFIKEQYSWIDKSNSLRIIELGKSI